MYGFGIDDNFRPPLPAVYDNSLSLYEVISKMYNDVRRVAKVEDVDSLNNRFNEVETKVNNIETYEARQKALENILRKTDSEMYAELDAVNRQVNKVEMGYNRYAPYTEVLIGAKINKDTNAWELNPDYRTSGFCYVADLTQIHLCCFIDNELVSIPFDYQLYDGAGNLQKFGHWRGIMDTVASPRTVYARVSFENKYVSQSTGIMLVDGNPSWYTPYEKFVNYDYDKIKRALTNHVNNENMIGSFNPTSSISGVRFNKWQSFRLCQYTPFEVCGAFVLELNGTFSTGVISTLPTDTNLHAPTSDVILFANDDYVVYISGKNIVLDVDWNSGSATPRSFAINKKIPISFSYSNTN